MNMRTITFNELRKIKDSLPSGSMHRIADELGLNVDTVRVLGFIWNPVRMAV